MQMDFSKGIVADQDPDQPMPWNLESLLRPPLSFSTTDIVVESIRSFYFEGEPYRGHPTRVFAFYGTPSHSKGEKLPAVVLVHGGLGTAFSEWVKLWVSRGYAAIAFDHSGSIPIGSMANWKNNPQGGPPLEAQALDQIDWPLKEQWVYHAVADTILACSLLESFPEIDRDRIGLTGVSWGAVISSIVAGIDTRFKFVAPVYGCGFISD
ncbi:MAG: acetylxylan esterase, partial [Chthoniobacterales bacterium]